MTAPAVIGVDVGGTGVRASIATTGPRWTTLASVHQPVAVRLGAHGVDAATTTRAITAAIAELTDRHERPIAAVAIGSTGLALLGDDLRANLPGAVARAARTAMVLLCSDVLTSYVGALGRRSGAIIAAGTGAVAVGTDQRGTWRRADGWGGLLGDCGGGAWIGRAAVDAALRAHDGRPGGSPALLAVVTRRYGPPAALVATMTASPQRSALLAACVPDVLRLVPDDEVATDIVRQAGGHLADTLLAALPPGAEPVAAATGNLLRASPVHDAFVNRLAHRAPALALIPATGSSLDGAVQLAADALADTLPSNADLHLYTGLH
jgi:N-acetylglucosamine kinase-like BadF-type ATPase